MKTCRIFAFLILSFSIFLSVADAQTKKKKTVKKTKPRVTKPIVKPVQKPPIDATAANYKVLLEGTDSKVETPFIFVARDAETYALIRSLVEGLPESATIDFSKSAVVAAFAGMRNTGGFSVKIRSSADKTMVELNTPPKGAMTTQMITYPFQVATVSLTPDQPLNFELAATWTNQMQTYQVSKGEFEYTGGIAGISKKFNAQGTVSVLTSGYHSTYIFNLTGKGKDGSRKLAETASGFVKDGTLEIARLDAGSFAEFPHPPVKVTGMTVDKKLTLNFESLPPDVADGYLAKGKLEAVKK